MRRLQAGFVILLGAAIASGSITTTWAAGTPAARVVLLPSNARGQRISSSNYYQENAAPGQTLHLFASVGNVGRAVGRIDLVPVDARSGVYGGISYDLPNTRRHKVGSWVKLQTVRTTLKPGASRVVPFTVHVPRCTKPGQYVGGLTAFIPTGQTGSKDFGGLTIQLRTVAAVVVTVRGRMRAHLHIIQSSVRTMPTGLYLITRIRNDGSRLLSGHGVVVVRRKGTRKPVFDKPFFVDTTVPHTLVKYPMPWPGSISPGNYQIRVALNWTHGRTSWVGSMNVPNPPTPAPAPTATPQPGTASPPKSKGPDSKTSVLAVLTLVVVAGAGIAVRTRRKHGLKNPSSTSPDVK